MSKIVWKDATSYSRSDGAKVPQAWAAMIGPVRLYVTLQHTHYHGKWVAGLQPITSGPSPLGKAIAVDDVQGAQEAALKLAERILKPYADAYSDLVEERMGRE